MTTHHDDDRDFDAFLRGEDDLSALLRQAPQPEVPPALDARILAQARGTLAEPVLAEPAHAGRAAANDPAPAPWLMRMRVPLGLAATVVIGVSLSLRWTGWQEGTPVVLVSDSTPMAPAAPPAAAAKPEVLAEETKPEALRGQDGSGAAEPGAAAPVASAPPVRARTVPAPARAPKSVADTSEEEEVRPPPPPPPAPAPAPMALPAPAPAAPSVFYRSAPQPPAPAARAPAPAAPAPAIAAPAPATAPAAPAPALQPAPQASTRVEVSGSRIARNSDTATDPRAEQWLSLLTELLDRRLDDDARDNWARFRREFPDYPVPPALQARIDVLLRTAGSSP